MLARRRRHRPDHPQAVPQARRAHRLRRVPLLRLGQGAGLGPARQPDPRRGAQLRLRLLARARAGRSRTTASGRSSRRASPTSSARTATKIGLLPVELTEDEVGRSPAPARPRSTSRRRRSAPAGRLTASRSTPRRQAPAAQGPGRHRPDAAAGEAIDAYERDRERAGPRHHRARLIGSGGLRPRRRACRRSPRAHAAPGSLKSGKPRQPPSLHCSAEVGQRRSVGDDPRPLATAPWAGPTLNEQRSARSPRRMLMEVTNLGLIDLEDDALGR